MRERIVAMALEITELSPRELATRFTDTQSYFVSESSVYRLLKAHDLITMPAATANGRHPHDLDGLVHSGKGGDRRDAGFLTRG